MVDIKPAEHLLEPLRVQARLLVGAGPSNPSPRVHAASSLPQVIPSVPSQLEMKPIMADVRAGIRYGFQTQSPYTFCVSGSGHAAMESICLTLLEPGEVFLICENGFWGFRMKIMAEIHNIDVRILKKAYGEVFSTDEIEQALKEHRPKVMFIVHGESSAGTLQPIDKVGPLCHKYDCLLLVDTVAAMGAVPFYMDKWEIDAAYSGAQKVLNSLTGISPVALSTAAWEKATNRQTKIPSVYLNATLLARMWGCFDNQPSYQHSPPNTNIYAIREAFSTLATEGLEESWRKHKDAASLLYKGLEELGVELLVKDVELRLPTVTSILIPDDLKDDSADIIEYMATSLNVGISMGFATDIPMWRIGLMGQNATSEVVHEVLVALRTGFKWARSRPIQECDGLCENGTSTINGHEERRHLKSCKMSFTSLTI